MALFKPRRYAHEGTKAAEIDRHMREIRELFPGSFLTLVIRSERFDKPVIVSNDQQAEAIKAMREMMPGKSLTAVN